MDSFTQIVLGVGVAQCTLPKKIGNHALWVGALFGTLPDLDVWLSQWLYQDPLVKVLFHRGFSHSILFFMILSVVCAYFFRKIKFFGFISYAQWVQSIFLILLTHSLLDIFTTWGTQIFWPLSTKISLHSIFVIDIFYTLPLLFGVIWSIFKKQVKYSYIGLIISTLYLFLTLAVQYFVKTKVIESLKNEKIEKIIVKPTAFNIILWTVIIEKQDSFFINQVHILDQKIEPFFEISKQHYLLQDVSEELKNTIVEVTQNQYTVEKKGGLLVVNDMRFGFLKNTAHDKQFAFSYLLKNEKGRWQIEEQTKQKRDGKQLIKNIIERVKNPLNH